MLFLLWLYFKVILIEENNSLILICCYFYFFSAVLFIGDTVSFYIGKCNVVIGYSFVLMLSIAALFDASQLIFVLLFSVLHEFGHLIALLLLKGYPDVLRFSFYGFALKYSCCLSRAKESIVLLSGPAMNLVLYLILKDDYNLILFILNMLPVYPLDGGRVIYLFSKKLSKVLSMIFFILIFIVSIYLIIFYDSFSLFLICIYLFVFCINDRG